MHQFRLSYHKKEITLQFQELNMISNAVIIRLIYLIHEDILRKMYKFCARLTYCKIDSTYGVLYRIFNFYKNSKVPPHFDSLINLRERICVV